MFGKPAIGALTLIQLEVDKSRNFPESAHLRSPTRGRLGEVGIEPAMGRQRGRTEVPQSFYHG